MTVRIGVIGTGAIGTDHIRLLSGRVHGGRVVAVSDPAADRARAVAAEVGAAVLDRATDIVEDPGIDAVLIASPGDTHAELVLSCLATGKPVLCEKPLATTADAGLKVVHAEVAQAAAPGRRLVQVGFMRRYDRGYQAVRAAVADGSIGVALLLHCVHRNALAAPGFTSDMAMTESVIHEIDAARWLLGEEIVAATVHAPRRSPLAAGTLADPQLVLLETESGTLVEVEIFVNCRYGYDVRCEVVGSIGTVTLAEPSTATLHRDGRRGQSVPAGWRDRFGPAYQSELQAWVDAVAAGTAVGPSCWDGYAAAAVAQACVSARSSGLRTPVALAERPALYG